MHGVTAVIPAYNEGQRILQTPSSVAPFVTEMIVMDDCNTDGTGNIARDYGAIVYKQAENKGYIETINLGFKHASEDIVFTIDADGEFSASGIPRLISPIVENQADMVQGHRNLVPRPSERVLNVLASMRSNVGDSGTGFRAVRTALARKLTLQGKCICGIFALEVIEQGGRIVECIRRINDSFP
jgi:glycosyltransferase involved in cell wall biosynthesis